MFLQFLQVIFQDLDSGVDQNIHKLSKEMSVGKNYISMSLRHWGLRTRFFIVKVIEVVLLLLCIKIKRCIYCIALNIDFLTLSVQDSDRSPITEIN